MGLFSRKPKGEPLKVWNHKYKCDSCGHDKWLNIKYREGDRFDSVTADCAKCGRRMKDEGPFHDPKGGR